MIIIDIPGVLGVLKPTTLKEKHDVLDSSYNMIVSKFDPNPFNIVDHLQSQHIPLEDFLASLNYMIGFYQDSNIEEYSKCQKLCEIKEYVTGEYEDVLDKVNAVPS